MGLYLRDNSTVWWVRFKANGRAHDQSTGTHDRRKAEAVLCKRRADAADQRFAVRMGLPVPDDLADARVTLAGLLERYREHYVHAGGPALRQSRERSWKSDLAALRCVLDFLGRKGVGRVAAVAGRHIEAFRDWRLTTGVSAATVNKSLRCGKAAWSWAVRAGLARANPFKGVKVVPEPRYDPRNLSAFEVRRVLDAARAYGVFPLVATAIYAGLRISELISLEWHDLDFEADLLRVGCDERFVTKSRKSRVVPLAPELRAILEPLRLPSGLCFPSEVGGPRDDANVRKTLARIAKRAGVAWFTPHDLRRTFASLLAARGVPTTRIRDYLGHSSVAVTEGYYLARGQVEPADVAKLSFGGGAASTAEGTPAEDPRRVSA